MSGISKSYTMAAVVAALLMTTACSSPPKEDPKKETGSLMRTLNMTDEQNRHYGTVELSPINGGTVYDAHGNVIGEIVPPGHKDHHDHDHDDHMDDGDE
jgi:hypothetical protein